MTQFLPWILAAYLVGTIPFGLLIGLGRGIDIRQHGSGNIGATNAGRVLGHRTGVVCFILDFLKGFAPTLGAGIALGVAGRFNLPSAQLWGWLAVAAAAILGHVFPVWLRFKGGKGVATGAGAMMGVFPIVTLAAAGAVIVWCLCAWRTRYVSLSSCAAAVSLPALVAGIGLLWGHAPTETSPIDRIPWPAVIATSALAALVVWTHRSNIARLRAGTEPRIGHREPPASAPA